jgi:hypothetical protein
MEALIHQRLLELLDPLMSGPTLWHHAYAFGADQWLVPHANPTEQYYTAVYKYKVSDVCTSTVAETTAATVTTIVKVKPANLL